MAVRHVPRHLRSRYVQVGQLFWSSEEVRDIFRRTDATYAALAADVEALPRTDDSLSPEWRERFHTARERWATLRGDTCEARGGDPCGVLRGGLGGAMWADSVGQARELADEVNVLRRQFRDETGREPSGEAAPMGESPNRAEGDSPAPRGGGWWAFASFMGGALLGAALGFGAAVAAGAAQDWAAERILRQRWAREAAEGEDE